MSIGGRQVSLLLFWLPFAAAFLLYTVAVYWEHRAEQVSSTSNRGLLTVILLGSILFRLTLLFSPPSLSDDLYRYVWDGRMQNAGINPYLYSPNASEIASFRDEFYPGINNKPISTIYPPLTEFAFWLVDALWHSPYAMKVFFTLCDLGIVALVLGLLRYLRLPESRVLIYAWNPLILVEVAGSGHSDPLAVVLLLMALLAVVKRKPAGAIILLALSFVAKFFSVVLIPAFYQSIRRVRPFFLFPLLILLFYLPYATAGKQLFHGLLVYSDKWRFNDSLFTLFLYLTGSLSYSKALIGSLFLLAVLIRIFQPPDPIKTAFVLIGAYLLLTPTFQPWYMVWIIPFLCLFPNPAWILLSGLVMASYHVLILFAQVGIWKEAEWIRLVQFLPFYGLLLWGLARKYLVGSQRAVGT